MAIPAETDPPELTASLWEGFGGRVGFDVGANFGQSVAIMLGQFEHVVCFEPSADPFSHLHDRWGHVVTACFFGVSDTDGSLTAAELQDGQYAYPGTHGLTESDMVRTAPCRTLDSLRSRFGVPDFVKVDTEGHEAHVLRGAQHIMAGPDRPDWLIEFHSRELHTSCLLLLGDRYQTETVRHPHYEPGSDNWHGHGWIRALAIDSE